MVWSLCSIAALVLVVLFGCARPPRIQQTNRLSVRSPDGTIEVVVHTRGALTYDVSVDRQPILSASRLGLRFADGREFGGDVELKGFTGGRVSTNWENPFGKRRWVTDAHNELRLMFRDRKSGIDFGVTFRVFNDGLGFRYELRSALSERFVVEEELTQFSFVGDDPCYAGQHANGGFRGSQEWEFKPCHLSDLPMRKVVGLPLLVQTPPAWVAIAEADLYDWSGMWLSRAATRSSSESTKGVTLSTKLAPRQDGQGLVVASTPHDSPWRVLMIGRQPGRLIESDLVLNLSTPNRIGDTSWIKPGLMAWDRWWSGIGKMDTASLKDFIALAGEMGWPYQLIDAGWYVRTNRGGDITNVVATVDMAELRRFAAEKGVRLWVWLHWTDVNRDDAYTNAFPLYEQAGLAGVKIDFMDRDDQEMVNWYEKITRAAAAHHLMVDFHGAFKPTGMNRTYPNQITREGVLGNEYNKWSGRVTPEHKVTLPFTRFLVGPGDFTPGGFLNRQPGQFQTNAHPTQVQGTRAAELALFVLYDSPVGCVCDHPSHYLGQAGADFLQAVPTVWDDTRVLDGDVGKYLVMARQSGESWFMGALTDRNRRRIPVKLDFLGPGEWSMTLWKDAADADANAESLLVEESVVTARDTIDLSLAPAGGAVARFTKE